MDKGIKGKRYSERFNSIFCKEEMAYSPDVVLGEPNRICRKAG
jgi:hypothetical protein